MSNYKIVCTHTQLAVIQRALEALARAHAGQFAMALAEPLNDAIHLDNVHHINLERSLRDLGDRFLEWSFIDSDNDMSPTKNIAWDMVLAIRQLLAYVDTPTGGGGIPFADPFQQSQEPPLEVRPTDEYADPRPCQLRLFDELEDLIGTTDPREALERVKLWKKAYIQ